ncbi:MAG TPA: phosphatidylinositol mannoside acyltransferase [Acidimicrobiia bacterium]|nr:phosphatidylinositol mannoside acyltransferase [Acidimicrobiia bacterium]
MATTRRLKRAASYIAIRAAAGAMAIVPERLALSIGRIGGRVAWLIAGERRKLAIRHMRRVAGEEGAEQRARRMYSQYGRYWAEVLWMRPRRAHGAWKRVTVEGLDRVLAARDAGSGMIFALPHLGNWEIAGTIALHEQIELLAVAEKLGSRRLVDWFVELRNMLGIQIVLADGTREVFRRMFSMIERGGAVALLSDRDLSGRGVEVEFFGEKTTLPGGAVSIGMRTGAPVFPVGSFFQEGRGHRVVVGPPISIPTEGSPDQRLSAGVQALAGALEDLVRVAPDQWHLLQPNWPSDRALQ